MRSLEQVNIRTNVRTYVRTYSHTYVRYRPYIPSTTLLCEGIIRDKSFIIRWGGGGGTFSFKSQKSGCISTQNLTKISCEKCALGWLYRVQRQLKNLYSIFYYDSG